MKYVVMKWSSDNGGDWLSLSFGVFCLITVCQAPGKLNATFLLLSMSSVSIYVAFLTNLALKCGYVFAVINVYYVPCA